MTYLINIHNTMNCFINKSEYCKNEEEDMKTRYKEYLNLLSNKKSTTESTSSKGLMWSKGKKIVSAYLLNNNLPLDLFITIKRIKE